MIQFILILLGLVPSNDNTKTSAGNQQNSYIAVYSAIPPSYDDGGPVGGETGQTPPPRK
ncbi:putative integral membrane protein [Chryseobacterium sp. StRB126]|nr:putative integral membrane protein [Chryseobacterium sp. StRB126]